MTHEDFGYWESKNGGVAILDFAVAYDLMIVNSLFKKKHDHLVTFRSGITKTQIDCFLIRASNRDCRDCKVIPSEHLGTQHRLLIVDIVIKSSKVKHRSVGDLKVKWWNLTRENTNKLLVKNYNRRYLEANRRCR